MFKTKHNSIDFKYQPVDSYISVIIPVYNDYDGLKTTLTSLLNQSIDKSRYEIIVANDGAVSEIEKLCNSFKVTCISIYPNKGSYNARNEALKHSRGEYLAFTDADVIADYHWLENGVKQFVSYDYIAGKTLINKDLIRTYTDNYEYATAFKIKDAAYMAPTVNMMVKRSVIEQIGGFDTRLRSSGDTEFGDRVHRFKIYRQGYKPDVVIIHPPRGFKNYLKKIRRINQGHIDLCLMYPERFKNLYIKSNINYVKDIFDFNNMKKTADNFYKKSQSDFMQRLLLTWFITAYTKLDFIKRRYKNKSK